MLHSLSSRPRWRRRLALGLLLAAIACGGGAIAGELNRRAVAAAGMARVVCVAMETSPRLRLGMYWTAPIFSWVPSLRAAPMQACVELPFSPASGPWFWLPREWLLIP